MTGIELKADFKQAAIKSDKTVLTFELSTLYSSLLPDIAKLAGKTVFLQIDSEQQELPIDAEYEEQDALPLDEEQEEIEDVECEYDFEAPALPEAPEEQGE